MLSELRSEKKCDCSERNVVVYYPEKEDTLWSVSKKYGVASEKVIRANGLLRSECDAETKIYEKGKIIIISE